MTKTSEYYDHANYVDDDLLKGTGVIGLILGDQLHPPMVDDPAIWSDSTRWKEGAEACVRRLARNADIQYADLVVDIGCGVGGATRLLTREFGAHAIGLNISDEQIRTARRLGSAEHYVKADAHTLPLKSDSVDTVFTFNMFYHLSAKSAALREMNRVTNPGGTLAFDDWVITNRATQHDIEDLLSHWNPEPTPWITDSDLVEAMAASGWEIERVDDYAHVGKGVMAEYFAPTFEREVRPRIVSADPQHGEAVADHLRAAIDHTIRLYREGKMRYLQIIARKP